MTTRAKKKRNPADSTWRNIRASTVRDLRLDERIKGLEALVSMQIKVLANRVNAIEERLEAASRQTDRVERDNVEGGQGITPRPSTASTPETRNDGQEPA